MKTGVKIAVMCVLLMGMFASCRRFRPFAEEETVAIVGDNRLMRSEVESIFTPGLTPQDSLRLLEQYVESWVKKQLKVRKAEEVFSDSGDDIDRMVEDYRSSLLSYRLDQYYTEARIDTLVTAEEINVYYEEHKADFTLDRAIVKGVIVKMPAGNRLEKEIRELMVQRGDRYQDFLDLSDKNNFEVREMKVWVDFSDFLAVLPVSRTRDYDQMLTATGVQELRDGGDLYLVLIRESLKAGGISPPERVGATIRRILLNQRRQEIIREYENRLYNEAVGTKQVEIRIEGRN